MNFVLRDENAILYECGYSCDNALYIKAGSESFFITDGRYGEEASRRVRDAEVFVTRDLVRKAAKLISRSKIKKCRFDPKEWDLHSYKRLKGGTDVRLLPRKDLSHRRRILKSEREIKYLRKASRIGAGAFDEIASMLSRKGVGLKESRINFAAESILRDFGDRELSFKPITAISENASLPHALPGKRKLKEGDLFLLDAGVKYKGYCSDRTRTAFFHNGIDFGYEQRFASRTIQKIYDTVLKAHDAAIEAAKKGTKASRVDKVARDIIDRAGYGKYFVHSTGHGVGLDIHEMPYISPHSDTILDDGMVFTIEPGIYIPGSFGVRIEDTVVVRNGHASVL